MKRLIVLISMLTVFSLSCDSLDESDEYLAPDEIGVEWQLSENTDWYILEVDIARLNDSKQSDNILLGLDIDIVEVQPDSQITIEFDNADGSISELAINSDDIIMYNSGLVFWQSEDSPYIILNNGHPTSHVAIRFAKSGNYVLNLNRIEGSVRYGRTGDVFTGCGENYHTGDIDIPIDVHIAVP